MRYLTFTTEAQALKFSENEARERGCTGTTTHWYPVRLCVGGAAVLITDDKPFAGDTDVEPVLITAED